VAAAEGDFDNAIQLYREDAARSQVAARESLGLSDDQLQELQRGEQAAQATLGGEYRGQEGLHRAIDETVAAMKARRGP
jgi:hypothetical protein